MMSDKTGLCDLLVVNACVLSMDPKRTVYPNGAIAVTGREIVAVGREQDVTAAFRGKRVIDGNGGIVHPGLFDCHVHLMHTARGAFPDNAPWKQGMLFYTRWRDLLDDEEEYWGCLLGCFELLKNGVTCFMEAGTVLSPDVAAGAAEAVGIRGLIADPILWDAGAISAEATIRRAPVDRDRCLKTLGGQLWRNRDPHALVRGFVALYGDGTQSIELMKAAKARADGAGAIFSQHQSYAQTDTRADTQRFGEPPFVHYARHGLLGPNCTFTHCNYVRDEEVAPIVESGMSITWCLSSSMIWAAGGTSKGRHEELFQKGVNIGLGSDSANSCGRFDPAFQACLAVLTAREKTGNREVLSFENGLEMATIGGAKATGQTATLGSLEPGKRADIVIRSRSLPEAQPGLDPVQSIIFSAGSKSVDTVIVDGRIVLRHGHSTLLDEEAVYAQARESSRRMIKKVDLEAAYRWPRVV
jgi:cytosine/adenosine deaminase-related metal-dependent hydrolase